MNQKRKDEIADIIANCPTTDPIGGLLAYSGPVADYIELLERCNQNRCAEIMTLQARVDSLEEAFALERKTPAFRPDPALVKLGTAVVDNRPGVQISDVIKLIRAVKKS